MYGLPLAAVHQHYNSKTPTIPMECNIAKSHSCFLGKGMHLLTKDIKASPVTFYHRNLKVIFVRPTYGVVWLCGGQTIYFNANRNTLMKFRNRSNELSSLKKILEYAPQFLIITDLAYSNKSVLVSQVVNSLQNKGSPRPMFQKIYLRIITFRESFSCAIISNLSM